MLSTNLRGVEQLERKELFASLLAHVDDPIVTQPDDSGFSVKFDQIGGLDGQGASAGNGGPNDASGYTFYGRYTFPDGSDN